MRVLLVEDDKALGRPLREHIASLGYGTDWMRTCRQASDAVATVSYELVVLDLVLPDG